MTKTRNREYGGVGLFVVLGVLGFVAVSLGMASYSWRNDAVGHETGVQASHQNAKNALDSVTKRIMETAQVPTMYTDDVRKVTLAAMQARYGEEGSKAVFQWIQENNPQLDSSIYIQLQRVIEAGRKEFQAAQTDLIDRKATYVNHLRYGFGPVYARLWGYPTIRIGYPAGTPDDYKIVTSDMTEKAFETGKQDPLKLRP